MRPVETGQAGAVSGEARAPAPPAMGPGPAGGIGGFCRKLETEVGCERPAFLGLLSFFNQFQLLGQEYAFAQV